ncbi:response regulator [Rhizobium sp. LjRoot30]|uniref:response regulator n=1 Tax=Rhizobium sp. LjRoot30 TaxID=3342320 RepID=UPI003ECEB083
MSLDERPAVVMVVEDEAVIRMDAVYVLEAEGHTVAEAESADAALEILHHQSDIDLIVTDVRMPGSMDGLGLARIVTERWPNVRIVVTSGFVSPSAFELPVKAKFFAKPYRLEQLVKSVNDLLAA